MTREDIMNEVNSSSWQPRFEKCSNILTAADNILRPHEDYFLNLIDPVANIIEAETRYYNDYCVYKENAGTCNLCKAPKSGPTSSLCSQCGRFGKIEQYKIDFNMLCNWQKLLFDYKELAIYQKSSEYPDKIAKLPNRYINLGLRTTSTIKVDNWVPPHPMFLEDLKEMCFPIIIIDKNTFFLGKESFFVGLSEEEIIKVLTHWYKIFQTIHFFEDLNGRLGGIVINILFYNLTKNYLTKTKQENETEQKNKTEQENE